MKNNILRKTLFAAVLIIMLPETGNAWRPQSNKYYASLTASVTPSGAGTVYVNGEDNAAYGESCTNYNSSSTSGYWGTTVNFTASARVNPGYRFVEWRNEGGESVSNNLSFSDDYVVSSERSTDEDPKAIPYTITAVFSIISYNVTYLPGDHGTGTQVIKDTKITDDITLQSGTIFTPDAGWKFKEWKVTSLGSTREKWALNQTFDNSHLHIGTGYYSENVTLTAQWEQLPCHIVIRLSGMEADESAIFTVSGGGKNFTVAVKSGTAVTLTDLTPGSYTVTPTSWSWVYEGLSAQSYTVPYTGHTFEFTATKKSGIGKHAEESGVNWRP